MNQLFRPGITIADAIRIAVSYSMLEYDEPYCVSALYENDLIALVVFTLFQRYEFYIDACSGEVLGVMSEPVDYNVIDEEKKCA